MSRDQPTDHHLGRRHHDHTPGDWTYQRDGEPEANGEFVRGEVRSNLPTPPPKEPPR